jgi:hypothetical protein
MYSYKYYRYINLPRIPQSIIDQINFNFSEYELKFTSGVYTWSDSFNEPINQWCQQNICDEMYWAFQIIRGDLNVHKDNGTLTKFCYLLDTGGDNVITNFFDDDKTTVLDSVVLEPHRWHVLKVDSFHNVKNIESGRIRFSITGKIF